MSVKRNSEKDCDLKIVALRECIENVVNYRIAAPKDFERLSQEIFLKLNILLSPTTLKRIWGYLNEHVTPRDSTLSILAQFIGYKDWSDFQFTYFDTDLRKPCRISSLKNIKSIPLRRGQQFILTDGQDRYCRIEYIGDGGFSVLESVNSDLKKDDVFHLKIV